MAVDMLYFLIVSLAINGILFVITFRAKTDVLVDLAYAVTFIGLTIFGLCMFGVTPVKVWVALMVYLWALRLASFLYTRISRKGRDERFDDIRGDVTRFGKFWIGQAVAVWLVSLPMELVFLEKMPPFTQFSLLGLVVWAFGLTIETIADWQKLRFSTNPKNQGAWINTGLWSYSRHPNYFGEVAVWLGIYLYAFPALSGIEAISALASPIIVFLLVRFISGVPILEKIGNQRWGNVAAYRDYKKRTSLMVPLPPKHL